MTSRRQFCGQLAFLAAAFPGFEPDIFLATGKKNKGLERLPIIPKGESRLAVPEGHRVAFGSDYFTLDTSEKGLELSAPAVQPDFKGKVYLRLQMAIDARSMDEVEVLLAGSGKKVGHFSIWYPTNLQVFDTVLDCSPEELKSQGLRLRQVNGRSPMFFFASTPNNGSHYLLAANGKGNEEAWYDTLCSDRSLQPFDWLEGCVLDGLNQLYQRKGDKRALATLQNHLSYYLPDDQNLVYVDLWARPKDNKFTNLEAGNNFAVIGQHKPHHPSVGLYLDFCKKRFDSSLTFLPDHLTQEGLYTLAYPLAVLGSSLKDNTLYEMAIIEAEQRIEHLVRGDEIYRMGSRANGVKELDRNWSRGVVWFLLGLVRTLDVLQSSSFRNDPRVIRLIDVYKHCAQVVLRYQQKDHSWKSFMHLEETHYETSGTSGLAAALAHGHRLGWVREFDRKRLAAVYHRLLKSMTPDGFLRETTQHNAGSYELMQKGTYRVISQYTLGFMGHIKAHL